MVPEETLKLPIGEPLVPTSLLKVTVPNAVLVMLKSPLPLTAVVKLTAPAPLLMVGVPESTTLPTLKKISLSLDVISPEKLMAPPALVCRVISPVSEVSEPATSMLAVPALVLVSSCIEPALIDVPL